MDKLRSSTRIDLASEAHRPMRATLEPAAWIRWIERVDMGLEAHGRRIADVPMDVLRGWFERHIGADEAIRRAMSDGRK